MQLVNIGFVKMTDGTYYNKEVQLHVKIHPKEEDKVIVKTPKGNIAATIAELEDAIIGGGFGDF